MELTVYAAWLNEVFGLFDTFFLGLHHELAVSYADILTPIANALGAAGHMGIAFGVLGVLLLIFRKTRMAGAAILLAVAIGGSISELFLEDFIARPRPYMTSDTFNSWWQYVGSPDAHGFSFPSGHVTGATAAMIALAYAARRWWVSFAGVIVIVAMAISRMYLQVHYPSDVLGGFFLGFFAGIVGYAIIQGIWRLFGQHPDQIAEKKAMASRHAAEITIPRGGQMEYAAVGQGAPQWQQAAPQWQQQAAPQWQGAPQGQVMPNAQPQARPAYAPARYADHGVTQTLQTAAGATVVVPGVPVENAAPDATQLITMTDDGPEASHATSDSGFQMAEEYYRD